MHNQEKILTEKAIKLVDDAINIIETIKELSLKVVNSLNSNDNQQTKILLKEIEDIFNFKLFKNEVISNASEIFINKLVEIFDLFYDIRTKLEIGQIPDPNVILEKIQILDKLIHFLIRFKSTDFILDQIEALLDLGIRYKNRKNVV